MACHLTGEQVVRLRQEKSYPVIKELEAWCKKEYAQAVVDSPIAKAMSYRKKGRLSPIE